MMRLIVLGGAAAWPNPGQGCSSYLVSGADSKLLLDCGPDTLLELRKHVDYSTIDAIVLSHLHSDHILDLVPYRYGLAYGPVRPVRPIPVWAPPGGVAALARLASALGGDGEAHGEFWSAVFDIHEYDPLETLRVRDLTITFVETQHFIQCFAMRVVDADDRSLFYSADTGAIGALIELARGSDLALIEGTVDRHQVNAEHPRGHLTPTDAGMLAREASVGALVLTHLWTERSDAAVLAEAANAYSGRITIGKPGMVVDV